MSHNIGWFIVHKRIIDEWWTFRYTKIKHAYPCKLAALKQARFLQEKDKKSQPAKLLLLHPQQLQTRESHPELDSSTELRMM